MTLQEVVRAALENGPRRHFKRPDDYGATMVSNRNLVHVDDKGDRWPLELTIDDLFADDWELVP